MTRIAEPQRTAILRWHGDTKARDAVDVNRNRLRSKIGKAGCEDGPRSSSDPSPITWSAAACVGLGSEDENVHKRYLIHVAGHNLGILVVTITAEPT